MQDIGGGEVEFYEVLHVNPKTLRLVRIKKKILSVNGIEYTAVPVPGSGEGKRFRCQLIEGFVPECRISGAQTVFLWDGLPLRGFDSRAVEKLYSSLP